VSYQPWEVNVILPNPVLNLSTVLVKSGGEEPTYEIIRKTIKKTKDYENPVDSFICQAYIKTLLKFYKLPDRLRGQKIEPEDKEEMGLGS
jgi:hypothetical protein